MRPSLVVNSLTQYSWRDRRDLSGGEGQAHVSMLCSMVIQCLSWPPSSIRGEEQRGTHRTAALLLLPYRQRQQQAALEPDLANALLTSAAATENSPLRLTRSSLRQRALHTQNLVDQKARTFNGFGKQSATFALKRAAG